MEKKFIDPLGNYWKKKKKEEIEEKKKFLKFLTLLAALGLIPVLSDVMIIGLGIAGNNLERSTIRRLKHKRQTIALINHNGVLFIYIFIGRSYYATKKLNVLKEEIPSFSKIRKELFVKFQNYQELNLEERMELSDYLKNLFCN